MSAKKTQVGGKHYADLSIQPVEYIHKNGLGFCEGCVVKYVTRWRAKGGIEDLRKARHFIDLLIEMETTPDVEWPATDERIDIVAASGGQGEHYAEDMSDPDNWRAGDIFEVVKTGSHGEGIGSKVVAMNPRDQNIGKPAVRFFNGLTDRWAFHDEIRFHSRPSADQHISDTDGAGVWTMWSGGDCPCDELTMVEVMQRNGVRNCQQAGNLDWYHSGTVHDIIRYRLL